MQKISFLEKDILTEVGSVCVGNATTALEQVLGRKIELELPSLQIVDIYELPKSLGGHAEDIVVGLHTKIVGGAKGNALLIFLKNDAFSILDLIMGAPIDQPSNLTELAISALKEMGNIVISSYLSALSNFVGISAFPSTVTFTSGSIDSLVNLAFFGFDKKEDMQMIIVEALLRESQRHLAGKFFIIFDSSTIRAILSKAKTMVNYDEEEKEKEKE
jgi:chemotaxis protein CheC